MKKIILVSSIFLILTAILLNLNTYADTIQLSKMPDIDYNGRISSGDSSCLERYLLGQMQFTNEQEEISDLNNDSKISSTDSSILSKIVVGKLKMELLSNKFSLVDSNNSFAFNIFKEINKSESDKNVFISPFSMSTAITMLCQGAESETKDQILQALGYKNTDIQAINSQYYDLISKASITDPKTQYNIANSIWIDNKFSPKQTFIDTNKSIFNAEVSNLNFQDLSSPKTINDWISKSTNGMITNILNEQTVIPVDTAMYIINTIYFKGDWNQKFLLQNTKNNVFKSGNNKDNTIPFMYMENSIQYGEGSDFKAVRLPYGNGSFSMYCFIPNNDINNFFENMSLTKFKEIKDSIQTATNTRITLPKFEMEYSANTLKKNLESLGMKKVFTDTADLAGIASNVYVTDIKHKAKIKVGEDGTEASAVSMPVLGISSVQTPKPYKEFNANVPFGYFIVDDTSNSIIFIGKAYDLK